MEKPLRCPPRLDEHAVGVRVFHNDVSRSVGIIECSEPSLGRDDGPSNWSWSDVSRAKDTLPTSALDPQAVRTRQSDAHCDQKPRMGDRSSRHEVLTLSRASDHGPVVRHRSPDRALRGTVLGVLGARAIGLRTRAAAHPKAQETSKEPAGMPTSNTANQVSPTAEN